MFYNANHPTLDLHKLIVYRAKYQKENTWQSLALNIKD